MAESLDSILSNEKAPEAVPETPPPETPSESVPVEKATSLRAQHRAREFEAQGRDPSTGQFVSKEPEKEVEKHKEAAPPKEPEKPAPQQQQFTEKERAFLRAAEEERRKRQELEKRLAELEKPKEPPKPFWDDPEGAVGGIKQGVEEAKQFAREESLRTVLRTSEILARQRYQDFDAKLERFGQLLQANPALQAQWLQNPDPAEYAYKTAKNILDIEEAGGLDAMRQKIEKETRAKIETELKEREERIKAERAKLPPSLTEARATHPARPVWQGPTSMDEILKR